MSTIARRTVLVGLAGFGGMAAAPAWAQAIGRQSDPWAQVDPYADPRNGFSAPPREGGAQPRPGNDGRVFASGADGGQTLSESDEIALGRAYYPRMIAEEGGPHPDQRLQTALRDFCRPIFAASDRPNLPWEVTLVDNREPNAAAFAGGKVVVNSGLIPLCAEAGELAAVLGHEVGHVDKRHTVRGLAVTELLNHLRESGMGADGRQLNALIPDSHGLIKDQWDLFDKAFSREDESEADAHMMVVLDRLGVDSRHAIASKLTFLKLSEGVQVSELARTHPTDQDRLRLVQQLAATQRRPGTDYQFAGWPALKAAFPTDPRFKQS